MFQIDFINKVSAGPVADGHGQYSRVRIALGLTFLPESYTMNFSASIIPEKASG